MLERHRSRHESRMPGAGQRAACLLAAAAASTLAVHAAQDRAPATFEASTSLVAVPVLVLDASGKAVTGLVAEDFEVRERGRQRPVLAFEAVDALAPPPAPLGAAAPVALQAASRRQILFLLDLSFAKPGQLTKARQAAAGIVGERLGPRDLVAVATASTRHGLKLLVGFTSDRGQVVRALQTLGVSQKPDPSDPLGLTFEPASSPPVAHGWDADAAGEDDTAAPQMHEHHVERFLENLQAVARALSEVQGHKQVVLVSAGFQERILVGAPGARGAFTRGGIAGESGSLRSDDVFGSAALRGRLEQALQAFAAADAVVHVVDVTGMQAPAGALERGGGSQEPSLRRGQESLIQIAQRSGGRVIKEANDLGAGLGELMDASRHFYLLAFAPEPSGKPGRYHEIGVRVRRPGLRALHRQGYVELERQGGELRASGRLAAAEILAKGITGGALQVHAVAVPYRSASGALEVPLVIEVDPGAPRTGEPLEVYAYAFGADGRVADLAAVTWAGQAAGAKAGAGGRLVVTTSLRVAPGPHDVRFLVRGATSGRVGAGRVGLEVPAFAPGETFLYPPLVVAQAEAEAEAGRVRVAASRGTARPEWPFRLGEEPFRPDVRPRLVNGRARTLCVMFATGGVDYPAGSSFELKVRLVDGGGQQLSPGRVALGQAWAGSDGIRRFKLELTPQELVPGEYALQVDLRDPRSGSVSRSQRPVTVE